jgi:hypothetical protein
MARPARGTAFDGELLQSADADAVSTSTNTTEPCPLCFAAGAALVFEEPTRHYLECGVCGLVFVPKRFHPAPEAEKRRYDQHRNDPADPGFLARLLDPMALRLPAGAQGLDFGSGPTGALALMFAERGFGMRRYDPYYAPDRGVLKRQYDFLVSAEAIEHFFHPDREWRLFLNLVRKGGWIGIMTGMLKPDADFGRWWYKNDYTHVSFFSRRTFSWLAQRDGLALEFRGDTVALFNLPVEGAGSLC